MLLSSTPAALVGFVAAVVIVALAALGRLDLIEAALSIAIVAGSAALAGIFAGRAVETEVQGDALDPIPPEVAGFADTLTDPCLIVNARGLLVHRNPAAATSFPRARVGDPFAFTLRDPGLVAAIDTAFETGTPQSCQLHLVAPNEVWFRVSAAPYTPGSGETFVVVAFSDFTEQKRTDRMRGDFIANASHELRTPLTSLMGFIDTLQGPAAKDEAARARFLTIMRGQAERMSSLVDDLLSLSRIELRQHVKPTGEVNLNLLLREVSESLEVRLAEAGLTLDLNLPAEPAIVAGDRQELFEVFENLADNAIKYGGGGKRIEIALDSEARGGTRHAITVTDFGAGVEEVHVPRLTERFYRVDAEGGRKKKGTGLGLAIVKHIVQRHHGELLIRSRLGEGTRVEVLLPR